MSRPPWDDRIAALEAKMLPEFRDLARWMTRTLYRELQAKLVICGLPPDVAEAVARDALETALDKIERAAELLAATARASDARRRPH